MSDCDIWVVKLGGSLAGSEHLDGWMNALATCGGRVIVVPGGGPFADSVRAAQESMGLQDAVAHHMALLAMEQFGRALASLKRGYRIAASVTAIHRALRDGRVAVWAPAAMVLPCNDIPASWDISSDSLAAWLAGRLGVKRLLLVKHGAAHEWPVSAADLAARDIVDVAFPRFLADSGAQAFIAPPERYAAAAAAIGDGRAPGARIDLHDRDPTGLHSSPWPRSRRRAGDGP